MNNKNTVRAKIRAKIYELYPEPFEKLIEMDAPKRYNTEEAEQIVELFRTKIGYSKNTYDQDIFYSAFFGYIRWKETDKALYQSNITVRNHKIQKEKLLKKST